MSSLPSWRTAGLRYYAYRHFLIAQFGRKVHRVSVDAGFTCPNADGTLAVGGCVYCDNESFSPARRGPRVPITEQIDRGIAVLSQTHRADAFIAYFQPATNTYGRLDKLRRVFDEAFHHPRIIGLVIGTRPDCVPDEVLELISSYAAQKFVSLELGLQSVHERSLQWMNRAHDVDCFFDAARRSAGRGIDLCAHVILGIPGESREDMLATIDAVAAAGMNGIKIHNLHVVENTPLADQYRQGGLQLLERDEYIDVIVDVLRRLPPHIVVHRLTGDAPGDYLIAPEWVRRKAEFLYALDTELTRQNAWQGCKIPTR